MFTRYDHLGDLWGFDETNRTIYSTLDMAVSCSIERAQSVLSPIWVVGWWRSPSPLLLSSGTAEGNRGVRCNVVWFRVVSIVL